MKLYDGIIREILDILDNCYKKNIYLCKEDGVNKENDTKFQMILKKDMAYELGGSDFLGIGMTLFTSNNELCEKDEIIVIGDDLSSINEDRSFIRITIANINDENISDEDKMYKVINKIDYKRFKVNPKGYMVRISTTNNKEAVRISKKELNLGLSFENIGNEYINEYKSIPEVKSVKIVFITDEKFDYEDFLNKSNKTNQITESFNKIMDNLVMDCNTCNLKAVCDEVEELRKLHFNVTQSH